MCIKILVVMLKKGLTRQAMMKGKEKTITCRRKQNSDWINQKQERW